MMSMAMGTEPNSVTVVVVDSDITTNQVWDANNIYYVIRDDPNDLWVNVQALLVIEPGTTVIMGQDCGLFVNNGGTLIAEGTPNEPIIFTADFIYFMYPQDIGYYWAFIYPLEAYYGSPIYIEETASPATTIRYCLIEGANTGVVTDNIRLTNPIENNYLFGNRFGIYEYGPATTDIRNNLCFFNDYSDIGIWLCPDPNGIPDTRNVLTIEHNTCDDYHWYGITIHGVSEPNEAPTVHLLNNIISGANTCGLYQTGWTRLLIANTGYYGNAANKNWDMTEYNPIITDNQPYWPQIGEKPFQHHHLYGDSAFIDAGVTPVELTPFIGMTTNFDGNPDKGIVDIGFHHMDWDFVGVEAVAEIDIGDILTIADYWLTYSPFEPNSPGYIDPNLYIFAPNHPENWIDPNVVTFGGDWDNSGFVDMNDLAVVAGLWRAIPDEPNLIPVIDGNPNDGWVTISAAGCKPDTQSIFAYVNGKYVGQVYGFGTDTPVYVDVSESGNSPQQLKFAAVDADGYIAWSGPTEITYTSPLSYCILPQTYEPNEPIPFAAYNIEPNAVSSVSVYADGGQLVWSQVFDGNSISGSIPASLTGEQHIIDSVTFSSSNGASVSKTTVPKVPYTGIDLDVKALMIMPDLKLFMRYPQIRYEVLNAFVERGIKINEIIRLVGPEATWENVAQYGQYGFVKYIYILAHGDYKVKNGEEDVFRTCIKLADGWTVSCKASEFETPPAWCKLLPEPLESVVKTWASMSFDRLVFVYSDSCYGGRLKIDGNGNLAEGQSGQIGFFDGPHSDLSLVLRLNDTYESRAFHGWWDKGVFNPVAETTYEEWSKNIWRKMSEGRNLEEALNYAIEETGDFSDKTAVNNYRLKGQGLLTDIRLKSY